MWKLLVILAVLCRVGLCENDSSVTNKFSSTFESDYGLDIGSKVVGGETVRPGQYLYVVRLLVYFEEGWIVCSGTVLSDKIILTAAHCVYSKGKKPFSIWAQIDRNTNQIMYIGPREMYPHPGYTDKYTDDIAIIKLSSGRFRSKYGTLPVLLTSDLVKNMNITGEAVVAEWGKTSKTLGSPILQVANVTIIPNNVCYYYYGSIVTTKIVCTLDMKTRLCGGDSGGPLMITRNGSTYVAAVNVFGSTNCEDVYPLYPSGYTYIAAYTNWINSIIK